MLDRKKDNRKREIQSEWPCRTSSSPGTTFSLMVGAGVEKTIYNIPRCPSSLLHFLFVSSYLHLFLPSLYGTPSSLSSLYLTFLALCLCLFPLCYHFSFPIFLFPFFYFYFIYFFVILCSNFHS